MSYRSAMRPAHSWRCRRAWSEAWVITPSMTMQQSQASFDRRLVCLRLLQRRMPVWCGVGSIGPKAMVDGRLHHLFPLAIFARGEPLKVVRRAPMDQRKDGLLLQEVAHGRDDLRLESRLAPFHCDPAGGVAVTEQRLPLALGRKRLVARLFSGWQTCRIHVAPHLCSHRPYLGRRA